MRIGIRISGITLLVAVSALSKSFAEPTAVRLWEGAAPGAVGAEDVDVPTLTPFLPPPDKATGASVVVFPGGGYRGLADHEGPVIARWLNTHGIAGFVVKYRLAPRYRHPAMLQDAARAVRTVRGRADEWKVDPQRIGVMGFSAGGHLASTIGTHYDAGDPNSSDEIERMSSRPDLLVLCYPVITMTDATHGGSRKNLLGENPEPELIELLSNEKHVTSDTPPTFLFHTADDEPVDSRNSLMFASALREAGVEYELHIYQHGRHGVGLAEDDPILSSWPDRLADWFSLHGFKPSQEKPADGR